MLSNTIQSGDWKSEKHVPEIEYKLTEDGFVKVKASVGKEIEHPNTLEHHISWIKLFFLAEGEKFPVEIADYEFKAHGEGGVFTKPVAKSVFKTEKGGKLFAISYCNIHGLWESEKDLELN
ncbi:MAG: desulfoferrodoxin family protein [Peptoniphilaceae bacterium]|nr:superoxide reductase [Peptoniphilaceae bacterium]MDD7383914.1 desulfoferrodoxin family protein [Peptoniphilaceae bacterium]MDY3738057.1 desulfoferrodoxin family protein [Peptoniphilaceae bacterium]